MQFAKEKYSIDFEEDAMRFYTSKTCETLLQIENALWAEYIADWYYEEVGDTVWFLFIYLFN